VLVISEDLEELFGICDRLAVIHGGRLSPAEPRAAADLEAIGMLMAGAGAPADAVA
jgi:simple sugar transport system ATP-binding protein